jgi:Zn-finger domain-containing protein
MSSKLRRFEILLPLQFNDGGEVSPELLAEAVLEIVERFDAASYETQKVEGHWRHQGILYRDNLAKIVIDATDEDANREWMRDYKKRWKQKLEQLDLWLVSYTIDVD